MAVTQAIGLLLYWRCPNVNEIVFSSVLQQEEDLLRTWCFGAKRCGRYCPSQSAACSEVQTREARTVWDRVQSRPGGRPSDRNESCGNRVFGASDWPCTKPRWRCTVIWDAEGASHLCWTKRSWHSATAESLFMKDAVSRQISILPFVSVNLNIYTLKCNLTWSTLIHFGLYNTLSKSVCFTTGLCGIFNKISRMWGVIHTIRMHVLHLFINICLFEWRKTDMWWVF